MSTARHGRLDARAPALPEGAADAPSLRDLRIDPVTTHGWRISDRRVPTGDPFGFLAFVEQRGGIFEVTHLGVGLEWHEFDSLDAAAAFVAETGARAARAHVTDRMTTIR